ncbi:hypothetical protein F4801DRAFT_584088 [Xylaria longipes]|nr:hypothetical protein F4801DRAFT_584088 [Xylaria longipes]
MGIIKKKGLQERKNHQINSAPSATVLRVKPMMVSSVHILTYVLADVVLVDCKGGDNAQSEAAYYPNTPIASPETIAIVTSPDEGLRRWEESTTTAIFTDAGSDHQTGFTVTLGPRPNDGEIAGNASNTWNSPFLCYAQARSYTHISQGIVQVHMIAAASASSLSTSSRSITATKTAADSAITAPSTQLLLPSATDTALPSPTNPSHGQERVAIGIGVGMTIGTIILAVTALSLLRKYWNQRRPSNDSSDATSDIKPKVPQLDGRDIYEVGSKAMPVELPGCRVHIYELEAKPRAVKAVKPLKDRAGV